MDVGLMGELLALPVIVRVIEPEVDNSWLEMRKVNKFIIVGLAEWNKLDVSRVFSAAIVRAMPMTTVKRSDS
jgi:hypothetical protein